MTFDFSDTKSLTGVTATRAMMEMSISPGSIYRAVLATGGGGHPARIIGFDYSSSLTFIKTYVLPASDNIGFSVGSLQDTLGYKDQATGDYCLFNFDSYDTFNVDYYF